MVVSNGLNATTNLLFGSGLQTTTAIPFTTKHGYGPTGSNSHVN